MDYYAFEAEKGERFTFELFARRLQSPLDSYLRIVNPDGGQLALNDDLRIGERGYADSRIENWTAPADGKFALEVRDLQLRGGDAFVYFVEARRARPTSISSWTRTKHSSRPAPAASCSLVWNVRKDLKAKSNCRSTACRPA